LLKNLLRRRPVSSEPQTHSKTKELAAEQQNMGIPKFYRWLSERYPLINQVVKEDVTKPEFGTFFFPFCLCHMAPRTRGAFPC
jgi:hypothetical protein